MAWSNSKSQTKTFHQRYRVFTAAFWAQNGASFDLEKSDKMVLPPSALNELTGCNATFPVLLKIQTIDALSNKALPSNVFSFVHDFCAPEGVVYLSSWMIERLQLDLSGKSVVTLSLPTANNLKFQCPSCEFVQLQPLSAETLSVPNLETLVTSSLGDYYSSLRCGDALTVYGPGDGEEHRLTVTKLSGTETSYTPKCVRLSHEKISALSVGFIDPEPPSVAPQRVGDDQKDQKQENEDAAAVAAESDDENDWEIVSVEKVKSLSDLEWTEPLQKEEHSEIAPSSLGRFAHRHKDAVEERAVSPVRRENDAPNNSELKEPDDAAAAAKPDDEAPTDWLCPKCAISNAMDFKFCPKCGGSRRSAAAQNEQSGQRLLVQEVSVINDGPYRPSERRQTGWILQNVTGRALSAKGRLIRCSGDSDVGLEFEDMVDLEMEAGGECFAMMTVSAPSIANPYHVFFQMVLADDEETRICDMLRMPVLVKGHFDDAKENKIKQIYQMGFRDRNQIVVALKKWNWDQLKAVNWLATH